MHDRRSFQGSHSSLDHPREHIDRLERHLGEVMRQFIGGEIDREAREKAERYLVEARHEVVRLRQRLKEMDTAIARARRELERLAS